MRTTTLDTLATLADALDTLATLALDTLASDDADLPDGLGIVCENPFDYRA